MKIFGVKSYTKTESLINSIIFFIIGIILFTNPDGILKIVSFILGGILILIGIIKIMSYRKVVVPALKNNRDLVSGIIYILMGIISIIFFQYIETAFRIIVGAYLIFVGVNRLIFAKSLIKSKHKLYNIAIGNSIAMIIFGILLAFIPGLTLTVIGFFLILYALLEIVGYILFQDKKEDDTKEDLVEEATIVSEVVDDITDDAIKVDDNPIKDNVKQLTNTKGKKKKS